MGKSHESLRIAMLGHKRVPSREGGVEIVVEELSVRMAKKGHSVTCYNRSGHHVSDKKFDKERLKEYKGVRLKNVFTIDKRGIAAMSASFTAALCASFGRYDVVHFHAEGPAAMLWLPKLLGKRCIVTVHGLDHRRAKWGKFASRYILAGEKCAARFADEIIVLSEGVQQYFRTTYNRETVFLPNGVSVPEILPANEITRKYGLIKDDYILYLSRLVPEKGLRYLISAYKQLNTDKKLVIAGGSSDTEEYERSLKMLAADNDNIVFTGFVEGNLLSELYSNAYLYVLPSDLEGMPISLLEAMSYGNCCVVSSIPECANVVEDHGVIFEQSNISDLKQKLSELLDNPDRTAYYKENAAAFITDKYHWNDIVNETLYLYGVSPKSAASEEKKIESIAYK